MSSEQVKCKVLVTGFGPFLDITKNPSFEITSRLSSRSVEIEVVSHPTPIKAAYHHIHTTLPPLLASHEPDVVLHIGLAVDRTYFAVEQSAYREGYHDIPDVDRRVFTRAENKKVFESGKGEERLLSELTLENVVERWKDGVRGLSLPPPPPPSSSSSGSTITSKSNSNSKTESKKAKEKAKDTLTGKGEKGKSNNRGSMPIDVRLSDDVGNYVCGFIYYLSLLEMRRKGKRNVVFLHVPMLEGDEQIGVGVKVTEALIKALVESWREAEAL